MMKKISFALWITLFSIFTMNFIEDNFSDIKNKDELINQLKIVSDELSKEQKEINTINSFSKMSASSKYDNSTYETANMVNYDLSSKSISYEYFNMDSYKNRNYEADGIGVSSIHSKIESNSSINYGIDRSESYIPKDTSFAISPTTVIGHDDRSRILQTREWPYRGIVMMYMTFKNVLRQSDRTYQDRYAIGTGFMEGPNLMVTAAHCGYSDVSNDGDFDDGIFNPRFPDTIEVYAGLNGDIERIDSYVYYAKVSVINIQKEYFENSSTNYDWCAMQLDRDLGVQTGYYGKISNWYEDGAAVYSYGYPGDKGGTMWETHGELTGKSEYKYSYNFDTFGGQSGSPVFMTASDGSIYVCGIHTSGSASNNYATRINSFIYHYLNSFVESYNYDYLAAIVVPTDYGFEDAYPTDEATRTQFKNHTLSSGFKFQTRRYRTGYIHNEFIVMSPLRKGIKEAFIEYKFDFPVSKIEVDLTHWRSLTNEKTYRYNCDAVLRIPSGSGYTTVLDLLSKEVDLPLYREYPKTYTIVFPEPVFGFEFYMESKIENINDSNRGRICIGNMNVYTRQEL